jgi:uncharacterized small protein (DUF1192 family)
VESSAPEAESLHSRVTRLEAEIAALRAEVEELKSRGQ